MKILVETVVPETRKNDLYQKELDDLLLKHAKSEHFLFLPFYLLDIDTILHIYIVY